MDVNLFNMIKGNTKVQINIILNFEGEYIMVKLQDQNKTKDAGNHHFHSTVY